MIQGPVIVSYGREADDMLWAPYFEYVALAILCVQYVFYRSQRFLPMMSNIIFVRTLYIEIVVVCLDIAASFTSSRYAQHSLGSCIFSMKPISSSCFFSSMNLLSTAEHWHSPEPGYRSATVLHTGHRSSLQQL